MWLCGDDCHRCAGTSRHVPEVGSLDSAVTDHHLAVHVFFRLLQMGADSAMHLRKDRLSGHAILGCVPPYDEVKVGATFVGLLLEAASGVWNFAALTREVLPRNTRDGILR